MLANLADDFSAADVALAVGVSPRSLYRAFQDFRRLSFSQFVRSVRMEAAQSLLRDEPALPLKAVARRVGYGDYTSFWRHFRATSACRRVRARVVSPPNARGTARRRKSLPDLREALVVRSKK